jgi:hypothetical protein
MLLDITENELLDFIVGDFEAAWDALASVPGPGHRGNFLFGRHAVALLEVACRLCKSDSSGQASTDFSARLEARDTRYFTSLPGACWSPAARTRLAFELPSRGSDPDNQIIAALFNLIRNGQAHQYQQMGAVLADSLQFRISLTGAQYGAFLRTTFSNGRPSQHLGVTSDSAGNLWMTVRPDVLFLDVRDSIRDADLLNRGLAFHFMAEDRQQTFNFTAAAAEAVLRTQGHWS